MKKPKETFCCICGCSMKDNEGYPSPLESKILRLCVACHRGRSIVPLHWKPTVVYESLDDFFRLSVVQRCLLDLAESHNVSFSQEFLEEFNALSSDIFLDVYCDGDD